MIYWQLFLVFMRIGFFAIGGAYSFLPLIQKEVVEHYHWLSKEEFLDVLGIVKIFPGAISVKYATYTGYKMAGAGGAVVANLANLLSPVILVLIATYFYGQYKELPKVKNAFGMIQWVVFAMIIAVAVQTVNIQQLLHIKYVILVVVAFSLFLFTKIHPAFVIIAAGLLGALGK